MRSYNTLESNHNPPPECIGWQGSAATRKLDLIRSENEKSDNNIWGQMDLKPVKRGSILFEERSKMET